MVTIPREVVFKHESGVGNAGLLLIPQRMILFVGAWMVCEKVKWLAPHFI